MYKELTQTQADEALEKFKYQEADDMVKAMNDQKSTLQNTLKVYVKQLDEFILRNDSVRALKRKWRGSADVERDRWYQKFEATKMKKRELIIAIRGIKQGPPDLYIVDNKTCLRKVESCRLSEDIDFRKVVFSIADNDIIKTTETSYFDIDRFTFQILEDPMDIDVVKNTAYLNVPPTLVTTPKEIN